LISPSNRRVRALSLAEIIVVMGLFALLSLILSLALRQSSDLWVSSSSHQEATQVLRKVSLSLERDVPMISQDELDMMPVPSSLGGGVDGDAVWFLSHINPVDGQPYLKADGTPFWQCNVLYYSVIPKNVDQLASRPVHVGATDGYEDRCPYKVLIRKVIDFGPATNPSDEVTEEVLMTPDDIAPYLTRPDKLSTTSMRGEPKLLDMELVGYPLLLFRASPTSAPRGIQFDIRVVAVEKAERQAKGPQSLMNSAATTRSDLFICTHN
jgi:hypothetical protein